MRADQAFQQTKSRQEVLLKRYFATLVKERVPEVIKEGKSRIEYDVPDYWRFSKELWEHLVMQPLQNLGYQTYSTSVGKVTVSWGHQQNKSNTQETT